MGQAYADVKQKMEDYREHKGSAKPTIIFGN